MTSIYLHAVISVGALLDPLRGLGGAPRDFMNVPSFADAEGTFSWAGPKGHVETDEDRAIKTRAAAILDAHKARRSRYIGPGKPGAFSLLRDWYCGSGPGRFSAKWDICGVIG